MTLRNGLLLFDPRFRSAGLKSRIRNWAPTAAFLGVSGALAGIYISEWAQLLRYVPFLKGRYIDKSEK